MGETGSALGYPEAAAEAYELLLPYAGRIEAGAGRALVSWGAAARHLGVTATATSRFEDAERHFEAALRENERVGFRPWLAWTRYQYAQMLHARDAPGDRERASDLSTAAAELASDLRLDGLERRIATTGEPVPAPGDAGAS